MSFQIKCKKANPNEVVWDNEEAGSVKGLHLKVTAKGTKGYFVYYKTRAGVQRRPKIGSFPEVSVGDARKRASNIKAKVSLGQDPGGGWENKKREKTVSIFFDDMFEKEWADACPRWQGEVKRLFNRHIRKTFGSTKLSDVTPLKIRKWHASVGSSSIYEANRSLKVLSKLLNLAEAEELLPVGANPCRRIKTFRETKRTRFATGEELFEIVKELKRLEPFYPAEVLFIETLMKTGARPDSIEKATSENLIIKTGTNDRGNPFKYGVLCFEGKKMQNTGEKDSVILPSEIINKLNNLEAKIVRNKKNKGLFGCKTPRLLWKEIVTKVGCPDLWMRDLRRTFATVGLSSGVNVGVIGELLNHKSADTTKIYAKLVDTARVGASISISNAIKEIVNEEGE